MATNIELDEELIADALRLGKHRTKRAVIEEALQEYVRRRQQAKICELFGTIDFREGYDYKEQRGRS